MLNDLSWGKTLEVAIHKEKFSNQVCKYIQDKIISGELKSGERLIETKVARELGVSQSPVREALRELEVMGLVEIKPYSGCFVLPVDEKRLHQIYTLRSILECFAAREGLAQITDEGLAAMETALHQMDAAADGGDRAELARCDVLFHSVIVASARNEILERMWKLVGAPQWTSVTIGVHEDMHYFPDSHRRLLELARARDPEGMVAELEAHFNVAKEMVVSAMKKGQEDVSEPS